MAIYDLNLKYKNQLIIKKTELPENVKLFNQNIKFKKGVYDYYNTKGIPGLVYIKDILPQSTQELKGSKTKYYFKTSII